MAKTDMFCPFSQRLCSECAAYRGRHYYLSFCKSYRGYIDEPQVGTKAGAPNLDFESLIKWEEPWDNADLQSVAELKIKLKVIDIESGESQIYDCNEAKNWDWNDPEIIRTIGSVQITSWDKLAKILLYKAEKGYQEVEMYEFPQFMLFGGG